MSSILKALKKLEEEQAGREGGASSRVGGQFVAPARTTRPLLPLLGGVGAGLLLAAGLYALFGGPFAVAPPAAPIPLAEKPLTPAAISAPAAEPAQPAAKTSAAAKGDSRPRTALAASAPPARPGIAAALQSGAVEQIEIERREIPAPGEQWTVSHLTVSEILPASAGGRMAIVNDLPVMEGTIVEGAVVREIDADRVIFSIDGRSVVVPLTTVR